jgi:amidase
MRRWMPWDSENWLRMLFDYGPFTAAFNVSGYPAISMPLGESREGLPIGVHLAALMGCEDLLLQVAAELEQAKPWKGRQPSMFAG